MQIADFFAKIPNGLPAGLPPGAAPATGAPGFGTLLDGVSLAVPGIRSAGLPGTVASETAVATDIPVTDLIGTANPRAPIAQLLATAARLPGASEATPVLTPVEGDAPTADPASGDPLLPLAPVQAPLAQTPREPVNGLAIVARTALVADAQPVAEPDASDAAEQAQLPAPVAGSEPEPKGESLAAIEGPARLAPEIADTDDTLTAGITQPTTATPAAVGSPISAPAQPAPRDVAAAAAANARAPAAPVAPPAQTIAAAAAPLANPSPRAPLARTAPTAGPAPLRAATDPAQGVERPAAETDLPAQLATPGPGAALAAGASPRADGDSAMPSPAPAPNPAVTSATVAATPAENAGASDAAIPDGSPFDRAIDAAVNRPERAAPANAAREGAAAIEGSSTPPAGSNSANISAVPNAPAAMSARPATAAAPQVAPTAAPHATAEAEISVPTGRIGRPLGVEIARSVAGGAETLRVRLHPEPLGRVDVTLGFDDNGSLKAVVRAESPAALDMLRRDMPDLARALDDAGVRADPSSFRFESRSGGDGQAAQQQTQQQQQQAARAQAMRGAPTGEAPDTAAIESAYRPLRSASGVDLLA